MKEGKWVICSGGSLGAWAHPYLREADRRVGADRGALYLVEQGYDPDMALGDFDSVTEEELERIRSRSRRFVSCDPVWKDLTDTEMAMTWAMEQGAQDLVLVGVLGSRLDHSLANVHLLRKALEAGVRCRIVDAQNEVQLMNGQHPLVLHPDHRYTQVSLLPLSLEVTGINLSGFLYPLNEATLTIGQSLGISNVLVGEQGVIKVRDGLLLVIRSTDTVDDERTGSI